LPYELRPLYNNREPGGSLIIEEEPGTAYLLNAKDLNTLPIIDKVVHSGVTALKIEGRNKSVAYVSTVVGVYRQALDRCASAAPFGIDPSWTAELDSIDHRAYTTGFYGGELALQDIFGNKQAGAQVAGIVRESAGNRGVVVDVKYPFARGDTLSVAPRQSRPAAPVDVAHVEALDGSLLSRAPTNRLVIVRTSGTPLSPGDILRLNGEPRS
jgi:putative protease